MDIFGTTVTAIHEVWRITNFICGVVREIRAYEDNVSQLQIELEHEFVFLETFKKLFFDDDTHELRQFRYLPDNLTRSVHNILTALNKCLAEYRLVALKHGLDLSEAEPAVELELETNTVLPHGTESDGYRDKFRGLVTALRQKAKAPEWALFSKSKIQALLDQYSQWTERLRQVMTLMLLVEGRVGSLSVHEIATQGAGSALGLQKTAARQLRAHSEPPADFGPLEGSFRKMGNASSTSSELHYAVGTYTDAFGVSSTTVIMEKHTFDIFDRTTTTFSERIDIRSALVRKLAWTLKEDNEPSPALDVAPESNSSNKQTQQRRQSHVNLLPCLGYLPVAHDGYPSLIYSLPPRTTGSSILTLHDYILNFPRPALGDRFAMALSVAETVLDIHTSGWVHKGIWSRGILVIPTTERVSLYLVGWSAARPRSVELSAQSLEAGKARSVKMSAQSLQAQRLGRSVPPQLEPQLYHHRERYQNVTAGFTAKHDIYSVGVVLLEMALWTTMSKQFAGPINKAKEKGALPPASMVTDALAKLARGERMAQEMGRGYARVVQRCLDTDFEVDKHDEQESALLGQFQALVADQLSKGAVI
ncbi:hypothetical protein BDW60DRAFT_212421 [Aspergillus nidulans var. acristatus]